MEQQLHKEDFWNHVNTGFADSKEDVWSMLESQLDEATPTSVNKEKTGKVVSINKYKWAVACGIALIIGVGLFAKLYKVDFSNTSSVASIFHLPDGSTIELEPNAQVSFAPYWWSFDRSLNFEGNGFFEVEKGSNFSVDSELGTTEVLGTSFRIISTKEVYNVGCKTGKVRVHMKSTNKDFVLTPGMSVSSKEDKIIQNTENESIKESASIYLKNAEGSKLFEQLETQYNIIIEANQTVKNSISFTGILQNERPLDQTIDVLEQTLDISFNQLDATTYKVTKAVRD